MHKPNGHYQLESLRAHVAERLMSAAKVCRFKPQPTLIWLGMLFVCWGCQSADSPRQLTPAFYHWKATYQLSAFERERLNNSGVKTLYIHFFDVDWDNQRQQAIPKAIVQFRQKPVGVVIPVVFITNRTLQQTTPAALPVLARNISQMVRQLANRQGISFREVQVDCDWSTRTRDRYFRLLTLLTSRFGCDLSATIRLHQIKFADQTGIPPVKRGMLMLYNVDDWKQPATRNSIYDPAVASAYLSFVPTYPLPLDVVLPLFRWTVVYRNNRFLTFVNGLDRATLVRQSFLHPQTDASRFVAMHDTSAFGFSVRRGDLFRAEAVSAETLMAAKQQVLHQIRNPQLTFALYHLDSTTLASYSRETIQALFQSDPLP